jgi:hypothetical protein
LDLVINRVAEKYAPSGAYAVKQVEHIFDADALSALKSKITNIVVNQMWEWDNYYDEQGVYYCLAALEKLATDAAVHNIKAITNGYVSVQSGYIYMDSIQALASLGKLTDLIELLSSNRQISDSMIDAFSGFETSRVISEIDKFLKHGADDQKSVSLGQLRDKILCRYLKPSNNHVAADG